MQRKIIPPEVLSQIFSESFEQRFWSKVIKNGPEECWIWTASISGGYGQIGLRHNGTQHLFKSHHLSWMFTHRCHIPFDKWILHSCVDCRRCCNPAHLRTGDRMDNIQDMVNQGRCNANRKGENSATVKLTNEEVLKLREDYSTGQYTQAALSVLFGIGHTRVSEIVTRKAWTHI